MLNSVHLIGRLGRDPELRYTPSGNPVAHFSLAVDDSYKKDAPPLWINVVVWNKPAEACHQFLRKGSLVFVGGRLSMRSWEDKEGVKRNTTEVIANSVQFLESRAARETGENADRVEQPRKKVVRESRSESEEDMFPF